MIGYQASQEQFTPADLLRYAAMAEEAGFTAVNSSDHFRPWSDRQGQSGYAYSWLGAAMVNSKIPYGIVTTPGYRQHPALVAQAAGTLAQMFPGRFWMALGSGQALNESITGQRYPHKAERNEILLECYSIIKRLLRGETVTHAGKVVVEQAKLYTLPKEPPLIIGAAVTRETAEWMGSWADGLITVHKPYDELKEVVEAFRSNGGEGKPMFLKVQLSYAKTKEEALQGAHDQWRNNILHSSVLGHLSTVEQFDEVGKFVQPEELFEMVRISESTDEHIEWLKGDISLGFERIILHNVNRGQELFIRTFGEKVLPALQQKKI